MAPTADGLGYWLVASDGGIFAFGDARFYGSTGALALNKPIVHMAATPDGGGLLAGRVGRRHLRLRRRRLLRLDRCAGQLNRPIVGMDTTPDGQGYWLAASDGGIFAFGDAGFYGSTGGSTINAPVTGIQASPTGEGYWLVGQDGGIFAFGDAQYYGSAGNLHLQSPAVAIT